MAVSAEYLEYVRDQLGRLGAISVRQMFGGAGVYCDGLFFAIVVDDVLYFKVDATNQTDYEAAGSGPFVYESDGKSVTMGYWEVPADVLESRDEIEAWARKAMGVALRAKKKKKGK